MLFPRVSVSPHVRYCLETNPNGDLAMCNLKALMSRRLLFKVYLRSFQYDVSINICPTAERLLHV
jgi:hypothetical protein